ncbi:MAG: hypothetical protein U0Y82_06815 [Thermoleophilia bacterium]
MALACPGAGRPGAGPGCAAGRVAVPLLRDGHEVWALDADPRMLAQTAHGAAAVSADAAARLRTVPADLTDFTLDARFRW